MHMDYADVRIRFLDPSERFILSAENEMPLVIEADQSSSVDFLQHFLINHSEKILHDLSQFGAILLRGFAITCEEEFEKTILSIQGLKGISEAFMSEEGRIPVDHLQYVLHTNAVYKTGGTLYLGGFHSENYYSPDVPQYICFCCLRPSTIGGETGLINMEKIYNRLSDSLKTKLEQNPFLASKWLISDVTARYGISAEQVEKICEKFNLPIVGKGKNRFILMYKPNIFENTITKKRSLQINFFEISKLNLELRRHFMNDYHGKTWVWHRLVWQLPTGIFKIFEYVYMTFASFFYSPINSIKIFISKLNNYRAWRKNLNHHPINEIRVGNCFTDDDVKNLARLMRNFYSSCLWQKGDILLIDNTQVVHAGMPGSGPRLVRAMICNPIAMNYSSTESGAFVCRESTSLTIGAHMSSEHEDHRLNDE